MRNITCHSQVSNKPEIRPRITNSYGENLIVLDRMPYFHMLKKKIGRDRTNAIDKVSHRVYICYV